MATQRCLCGFHGSTVRQCRCSPLQIENYLGKISGPLLDRIAIHVSVRPVDVEAWSGGDGAARMTSAAMQEMVVRAREIQARRFAETNGVDCNARITEGMFGIRGSDLLRRAFWSPERHQDDQGTAGAPGCNDDDGAVTQKTRHFLHHRRAFEHIR